MVFHCTNMLQFLIHSTTDGYLDCSQVLAIMNSAALRILVHVFWLPKNMCLLTMHLRVEILGHKVYRC